MPRLTFGVDRLPEAERTCPAWPDWDYDESGMPMLATSPTGKAERRTDEGEFWHESHD